MDVVTGRSHLQFRVSVEFLISSDCFCFELVESVLSILIRSRCGEDKLFEFCLAFDPIHLYLGLCLSNLLIRSHYLM